MALEKANGELDVGLCGSWLSAGNEPNPHLERFSGDVSVEDPYGVGFPRLEMRDPVAAVGGRAWQTGYQDRRSAKIADNAALIHAAIERQSDVTLEELRTMLVGQYQHHDRVAVPRASSYRAQKETAHASGQDRPDIVERR